MLFVFVLLLHYTCIIPNPAKCMLQKTNIFNELFVKWSWAWTMGLLVPFVYATATVYSAANARNIRQQMARLLVATLLWYFCTSSFISLEGRTGQCTVAELSGTSKRDCHQQGGTWSMGFDISGHCFILIYCCLIISEEVRCVACTLYATGL